MQDIIRLIIFFTVQMEKLMQSAKTRPGADYGSAHAPLVEKFRLKFKKVGKPLGHPCVS